ncbi:MAG TPA: hypothetical protein VHH88_01425 [Verrucomicrobiae bacterium]|nr:hypothetical protein [Verrucomicrobiae bacterium]
MRQGFPELPPLLEFVDPNPLEEAPPTLEPLGLVAAPLLALVSLELVALLVSLELAALPELMPPGVVAAPCELELVLPRLELELGLLIELDAPCDPELEESVPRSVLEEPELDPLEVPAPLPLVWA